MDQSVQQEFSSNGLSDKLSARQLYSPNLAALWSILLTPVFGAAIVWSNWKTIGNRKAQQRSLLWLIGLCPLAVLSEFIGWFFPIDIAVYLTWYFLECRPQVKYLKAQEPGYIKRSWLQPLSIGAPLAYGAFIISMAWAFFATPTLIINTTVSAYERSRQDVIQYLDETRMEPLRKKESAGKTLSEKDIKEIQMFNHVVKMLQYRKLGELSSLPFIEADELMDYAKEQLYGAE